MRGSVTGGVAKDAPILLTGRGGQIGGDLLPLLAELGGPVIAPGRDEMDLRDAESVRRAIRECRPRLIVNAAAYTAVDQAEVDEAAARAVNAEGPAIIAEEARKIGAAIIHYSTDYVFDGTKATPYTEDDLPRPLNAYGRTKLEGEQAIRDAGVPHLIFRTAWVYSARGKNFVLTVLRLGAERDELKIVADQHGSPTWRREIAAATSQILSNLPASEDFGAAMKRATGTYHMTAGGETTWFGFADAMLEKCAAAGNAAWVAEVMGGRGVRAKRVMAIGSREYPTTARRPTYSVLDNSKLRKAFGCVLPDWREQIGKMFRAG